MSKIEKLIAPFIDKDISLEDFNESTGFIGMYFEDINRPFLDNHVFLLYNWSDKKSVTVFYKYKTLSSFYGYKIVYLKGIPYIVYTFTSNNLINRLKTNGDAILRDVNKVRILQFWNFKDAWIALNVVRGTITCDPPHSILPEEDFMPDEETIKAESII